MIRAWCAVGVFAVIVMVTMPASAAGSAAAEALFRDGVALAQAGELEKAVEKFKASYELEPSPGTLQGLALAEEKLGRVAAAWAHYRELLERATAAKDKKRIKLAKERIVAVEGRLAKLTLTMSGSSPSGSEIRLDEPRNHFLYLLAMPALFAWPRHVYEREGPDWHRALPLVGNGPFVLTSRDDDRLMLEAAPSWRGPRGNVGEVTIGVEAWPAIAERWGSGDYDVLDALLAFKAVADHATVVQRSPGMWTCFLGFDAQQAPLDDARVRRAFAHAIDRHAPAELLRGTAAETGGLLPPTMPGHSNRIAPGFDPDRARALLSEAGYEDVAALDEIVLLVVDMTEDAASAVAAQLEQIGVRVRLLSVASFSDGLSAIGQRAAHAWFWGCSADLVDPGSGFLEPVLRSEPRLYRDDRLERLLARAASLRDQDERLRIYREFERIWIGEHAAVVPLAYGNRDLWRRPWVTGMWVNALAASTLADAVVSRPQL